MFPSHWQHSVHNSLNSPNSSYKTVPRRNTLSNSFAPPPTERSSRTPSPPLHDRQANLGKLHQKSLSFTAFGSAEPDAPDHESDARSSICQSPSWESYDQKKKDRKKAAEEKRRVKELDKDSRDRKVSTRLSKRPPLSRMCLPADQKSQSVPLFPESQRSGSDRDTTAPIVDRQETHSESPKSNSRRRSQSLTFRIRASLENGMQPSSGFIGGIKLNRERRITTEEDSTLEAATPTIIVKDKSPFSKSQSDSDRTLEMSRKTHQLHPQRAMSDFPSRPRPDSAHKITNPHEHVRSQSSLSLASAPVLSSLAKAYKRRERSRNRSTSGVDGVDKDQHGGCANTGPADTFANGTQWEIASTGRVSRGNLGLHRPNVTSEYLPPKTSSRLTSGDSSASPGPADLAKPTLPRGSTTAGVGGWHGGIFNGPYTPPALGPESSVHRPKTSSGKQLPRNTMLTAPQPTFDRAFGIAQTGAPELGNKGLDEDAPLHPEDPKSSYVEYGAHEADGEVLDLPDSKVFRDHGKKNSHSSSGSSYEDSFHQSAALSTPNTSRPESLKGPMPAKTTSSFDHQDFEEFQQRYENDNIGRESSRSLAMFLPSVPSFGSRSRSESPSQGRSPFTRKKFTAFASSIKTQFRPSAEGGKDKSAVDADVDTPASDNSDPFTRPFHMLSARSSPSQSPTIRNGEFALHPPLSRGQRDNSRPLSSHSSKSRSLFALQPPLSREQLENERPSSSHSSKSKNRSFVLNPPPRMSEDTARPPSRENIHQSIIASAMEPTVHKARSTSDLRIQGGFRGHTSNSESTSSLRPPAQVQKTSFPTASPSPSASKSASTSTPTPASGTNQAPVPKTAQPLKEVVNTSLPVPGKSSKGLAPWPASYLQAARMATAAAAPPPNKDKDKDKDKVPKTTASSPEVKNTEEQTGLKVPERPGTTKAHSAPDTTRTSKAEPETNVSQPNPKTETPPVKPEVQQGEASTESPQKDSPTLSSSYFMSRPTQPRTTQRSPNLGSPERANKVPSPSLREKYPRPSPPRLSSTDMEPLPHQVPRTTVTPAPRLPKAPFAHARNESAPSMGEAPISSMHLQAPSRNNSNWQPEAVHKVLVECCKCDAHHDLPTRLYERMNKQNIIAKDPKNGVAGGLATKVNCPWCQHEMTKSCCAGYTAVVHLKEKLH